ncbi:MAG: CPBP family intramembrane glutamic endopeptidase [Bacteroidales bacterium]|jgi:membrane protease YdiL (CAAX protease family)
MSDKKRHFALSDESPLFQLFVSLLITIGVGSTLFIVFAIAGKIISGCDLTILEKSTSLLSDKDFRFLRYLLIIQDISLLIIPSVIILAMLKPPHEARLSGFKLPQLKDVGLVVILAFCIFPVTSFTGQINSAMHLPDWLSGVEKWIAEKEDHADSILNQALVSPSISIMILNLFIIAILPAIGEELFFRGVLQKIFYNLFKSGHIAVWFTAFIFSTLHFQFFGFVPRFILGLVFGYLFFWSGTLWLPVISHFVNNAVPVMMAYIQGIEKFNAPFDTPLWKQAIALPLPIVIGLVILFYFRNKNISRG